MNHTRWPWRAGLALVLCAALASSGRAKDWPASEARAGSDLAHDAAISWAQDASLVYIENDDPLDRQGTSTRWGYLYYSPSLKKNRAYSVRDGRIVVAEDLEMKFEAPPLAGKWIDSGAAMQAAEQDCGRAFCRDHGGRLANMLLMRGALYNEEPDESTWMLVYTSPSAPSLFVVVDAESGKVRRTWRG
jgi:hypothetical protein